MKKIIVLSPGHGGSDPGAIEQGLVEKRLTWEICQRAKARLNKHPKCECIVVQLSSVKPDCTGLEDIQFAVSEANRLKADYYFAIHINAGGGTGFESFIDLKPSIKEEKIQRITHSLLSYFLKQYQFPDRGMKRRNFYEVLKPNMPAVLYEFGFIDNPRDAEKLSQEKFIDSLANQLAYSLTVACLVGVE